MLFFILLACAGPTDSVDSGEPTPGVEVCNGHDDDGDGLIDEGLQVRGYIDVDGDGFGAESSAWVACEAPPDAVTVAGDCDDTDPAVHPDAIEACDTPFDDNCDGVINPAGAVGCTDVWADTDGDGLGGGSSSCVCDPGDRPRTGDDCDPSDIDRGLDCTEGTAVPPSGARLLEDDDLAAWTLLGAADADGAPGDELLLSTTGQLAVVTLPRAGDTLFSEMVLGTVALTDYSFRALGPGGGTTELIEASYQAVLDPEDPSEAFHTVFPTLRGFAGPLTADTGPAWSWDLDPIYTSFLAESLFVADLDGDGIPEGWYASGTTHDRTGQAALWRGTDAGATELLRTKAPGALYNVAPLGDSDGDGLVDLGVLSFADGGSRVSMYPGPVVDTLPPASAVIVTSELFDLVALGDMDGDGYDDVALRGERIHVLRGPLESGVAADLAATRIGPESDDVHESALFVAAGDMGRDERNLIVTDTYWTGRVGTGALRGAVYVFHQLPTGVVDVRAADTRVYGLTYGAFGAYPTVLDDGRLLTGAHLENHAEGRGVFWVLDGL